MDAAQLPLLDAEAVSDRLPFPALIEALSEAFAAAADGQGITVPDRLHGDLGAPTGSSEQRDLLVMPAWFAGGTLGVKLVTLFDDNAGRDRPRIQGLYVLFDAEHGGPTAILDAAALTTRRTAAASALAADHLARSNARSLTVVGSGRLARALPVAYAAVRDLERVRIWARRAEEAEATAADVARRLGNVDVAATADLEGSVREADMISSAVPSTTPIIRGAWLRAGQHLDLIGSYRPDMHEADTSCLTQATVFVDTRPGVLSEAGEFIDAIASGAFEATAIAADLGELAARRHAGRRDEAELTLFKSVGTALEDLVAARLAVSRT